ncbi:Sporulation related domain-containing protein [Andreprevotia lacus DSM 23236]|jgi:hypothetical protein|uniref:Sporulation related domain-containing protein n=1 Tax=Andreprevotia lacus DSM 23236 TaxID=1121001 RepID=A0A1W1XXL3_9NEIS|nr:SPOR domain-containing protein [Andreprevotia lacus]SMC28584.1 Sporulation related domain-containing protein [Andreprevotia lacus DSM 23236]
MKWLFFILLVANLLFFGYTHVAPHAQPGRTVSKEMNASQVHIVNVASTPAPSATPAPAVADTPEPTPAPSGKPAATSPPVPTQKPEPTPKPTSKPAPSPEPQAQATGDVCVRWTGITGDQANLARDKLRQLGLTAQENTAAQNAKFWVYVPPLNDIETARKKAQQFAELGVDDYFVVNNGSKWQNAISLGIFSTQEAADRRLNDLRDKGVKSAIVRERDDGVRHTSFLVRKISDEQQAKLAKVAELLRGSQVEKVACK